MPCMSCTQKDLFSKVQDRFRSNLGGDVYPDGMDGVEFGTGQMRSGMGMDVGWSKVTKTTGGKGKVGIKKKVKGCRQLQPHWVSRSKD
ncbi:hypothetical protein M422DRAFT_36893 [Sphaerobolus stellatus SS14]|uniref:Uncharacterized protein n=1 Tax=Sphaerobolus stellatus (strain SS14) TaxID=990650 RepID=A0A0C9TJ39_SPHS4|nr:hypothetical protein M422DRAFT_36893 [Sphaerobolus stellatus SS14]